MNPNPERPETPDHDGLSSADGPTPAWGSPDADQTSRPPAPEDDAPFRQSGASFGAGSGPGSRFFDAVRRTGLVRPDQGRRLAGVCAGLAERWGMRPGVVRVLFVVFALLTGLGLLAYGLGWLLLPHPDGRIHAEQVLHGVVTGGFVGAVLFILMGSDPFVGGGWDESGHWHQHGLGVLPLIVVGLIIWWVVRRNHVRHG